MVFDNHRYTDLDNHEDMVLGLGPRQKALSKAPSDRQHMDIPPTPLDLGNRQTTSTTHQNPPNQEKTSRATNEARNISFSESPLGTAYHDIRPRNLRPGTQHHRLQRGSTATFSPTHQPPNHKRDIPILSHHHNHGYSHPQSNTPPPSQQPTR